MTNQILLEVAECDDWLQAKGEFDFFQFVNADFFHPGRAILIDTEDGESRWSYFWRREIIYDEMMHGIIRWLREPGAKPDGKHRA